MSSFTRPLLVEILQLEKHGSSLASVFEGFEYTTDVGGLGTIAIEGGFETDFASVPRALWWLFPPLGQYAKAAVVHDWLCVYKPCTSHEAALVFLEAMAVLEVPAWKRLVMYKAVDWFGPKF